MRYYPIFLDLRGRRCTVVGGGRVAERKVQALLRARRQRTRDQPGGDAALGAAGRAQENHAHPARLPPRRSGRTGVGTGQKAARSSTRAGLRRHRQPRDAEGRPKDAEEIGALVNAADDARESDFIVPASFAQGDLLVAISTSGSSPALARRLRRQLQVTLGREYRGYLRFLREARKQVMETVPDEAQRAKIFRQLSGAPVMDWFGKGAPRRTIQDVKKWLAKVTGTE